MKVRDMDDNKRSMLVRFSESEVTWDGDVTWVHAVPIKTWYHPMFGEVTVTPEQAQRMVDNFKSGVRGQDVATDYEHGLDPAKGGKASGWIKDMEFRDNGLWWAVQFTETARAEIEAGEWKYFSPEWYDTWTHPDTQDEFLDVVIGGGLTNKPYIKGLVPLNFSEVILDSQESPAPPAPPAPPDPSAEAAPEEHAEPGTGSPPEPRETPKEKDQESGSRRSDDEDDMAKGGETVTDAKLREILGLDPEADIIKATQELVEEVRPLREAAKSMSERKAFAESFPQEARELEELRKARVETEAKAFSERYERFSEDKTEGFSGLVLDKLTGVHKAFSEGKATKSDLSELMDLIAKGGIVDYGETGSSRQRETSTAEPGGKAFAEKIAEIRESDKVSYEAAVNLAVQRYPEEYKAYREQVAGRR